MILSRATAMLVQDEGCKLKPYRCTQGFNTLGVGRNLDTVGIRISEAKFMLENDISDCVTDLVQIFPDLYAYPEDVQLVFLNMRFQLGPGGFRSFNKMIQAFRNRDYQEAIRQMKDSKWYSQTTNRADRLINIVESET